jgi:L-asparaginase
MPRPRLAAAALAAAALAFSGHAAPAGPSPAGPSPPDPPRVHLIATGGTIAHTPAGPLTGEALVAAVPGLDRVARLTVEQFLNVGSSQITPQNWHRLALRIQELFRTEPDLAGVVVTHGTDTMEETAFFLHLTLDDPRPVVVTGAMRPADAAGADGPANLMNAVRLAVDPAARDRPVMVLMNDQVHAAPAAAKAHTTHVDAFVSSWGGPIGVADPDRVAWHTPPHPGPLRGAFVLTADHELPRVDIVYAFAGADGAGIRAAAHAGARGVVLATLGRGNLPAAQREAVAGFVAGGGVAVLSSRTQAGRVPDPGHHGVVGAGDLNPQKARVLLMLALARGLDPDAIQRLFLP